jgi:eukaryotic-like serine/threonine-protein kinase
MAPLRFQYICQVHGGCVVNDSEVWLVLDFVEGGNLHDFLVSASCLLSWDMQLAFALHATYAVNYLHNCRSPILHRDIKSHNFLVQNGNKLLLTDFGLSKTKETVTRQTATIGTMNWAAPEILSSEPEWSEKADIYSLGMVFYELITGEIPYKGETNLFGLQKKIKNSILPPLPSNCPEVYFLLPSFPIAKLTLNTAIWRNH